MKRRYKALIAILSPVVIMAILSETHPEIYNYFLGYIIAVVLVFKSSITSLWLLSKLKILHFIKGLTLLQAFLLGAKRWLIDNIVSQWLEKHILNHFKKPFQELYEYYKAISFRSKIKNFLFVALPLGAGVWAMYLTDLLTQFALFVQLKVLIISFFKTLWIIVSKAFLFLTSSWFAPIFEVFALSYLLNLLERFLGKGNPVSRFLNYIGDRINDLLAFLGLLNDKHIEPILNKNVSRHSKKIGTYFSKAIQRRKIRDEYLYFDNFHNIILKGHINAYHSFEGMEKIEDKKELYSKINENTRDNIDIIAYLSRNGKGELLEEDIANDFYHDIFLLKGIASNCDYGVKIQNEEIDHTDFWVLNTSPYPVKIQSDSGLIETREIQGNDVQFIKTLDHIDLNHNDLTFEYEGVKVSPTEI
jgi:hypothetical protein